MYRCVYYAVMVIILIIQRICVFFYNILIFFSKMSLSNAIAILHLVACEIPIVVIDEELKC